MSKKEKTKENNQWTSVPQATCECNCEQKKNKTATDNQWTSTHK